jgi:hypothetical protein
MYMVCKDHILNHTIYSFFMGCHDKCFYGRDTHPCVHFYQGVMY